jgi:hypothetical protein
MKRRELWKAAVLRLAAAHVAALAVRIQTREPEK